MKISTKKTNTTRNTKDNAPPRRKPTAGKKTSQKITKNRLSARKIFIQIQWIGKLAGLVCIVACIIFIGIHAYNSEKFQVSSIAIYGCKELDPQKVEQIIRDSIPDNILDIELTQLKDRLEQDPWIKDVEIRRVLPSGLIIHVNERIPSVIFEMQRELMIADSDGILLDRYDPKYGKLDVPVFKGIVGKDINGYRSYQQENSARIQHALDMLAEIESGEPLYARKISEVDITDQNNLKIILVDDTVEIILGNKDYLKRLQNLMSSDNYRAMKEKNPDLYEVDLRYSHQIAYRCRSGCTAAVSFPAEGN